MSTDFTCFAELKRDGEWSFHGEFDFGGVEYACEETAKVFGGPCDPIVVMQHGHEIGTVPDDCSAKLKKYAKNTYTSYPGALTLGDLKACRERLQGELSPHIMEAVEKSIEKLSSQGSDEDIRIVFWFS